MTYPPSDAAPQGGGPTHWQSPAPQAFPAPPGYGPPPPYGSALQYPPVPPTYPAPGYAATSSAPAPSNAIQPYSPRPAVLPAGLGYPQVRLVSAGGRIGAYLLDIVLVFVTLFIGYFIWSMFTWASGQTPAKQLLGHVVADASTGQACTWGRMALREFVVRGLLGGILSSVTCGIYGLVDAFMVFSDGQRTLHDRIVGTVVRYS